MKHFIIRPNQDSQLVQVYDGGVYFNSDITLFKQFEPTFNLPINIKQLEYHPGVLHQLIHYNGTVEDLELTSSVYDNYTNKVAAYNLLKQELESDSNSPTTPDTLQSVKLKLKADIYFYAATLLDNLTSTYSTVERDRWAAILLKEAEAYSSSANLEDAPNLVAQEQVRNAEVSPTSEEFLALLSSRVEIILNKNTQLTAAINHICGVRGKWTDLVDAFAQTQMETEKEAIARLLSLDWKQGWEVA